LHHCYQQSYFLLVEDIRLDDHVAIEFNIDLVL